MNKEIPSWITNLRGLCPCFNDIENIEKSCKFKSCGYDNLRVILNSNKRPTKTTFIQALILTGNYDFRSVMSILNTVYPPVRTEAITQRIHDTMKDMKKDGYHVSKGLNGCYFAFKGVNRVEAAPPGNKGVCGKQRGT